jgi:hypothetical protein
MEFWASSESHKPASKALEAARKKVEPFLNAAFAASSLASLQLRLRYVPIVMPESMSARYPPRSKSHLKERIYDCAPALNYEVFVRGTSKDQIREYLRGISQSAKHLPAFGASPEQINAFTEILGAAADRVT